MPDALDITLYAVSLTAAVLGYVYWLFITPPRKAQADLSWGISNMALCVDNAIHHRPVTASIQAAAAAILFWLWWNNGGGDDTKRRLRKLGKAFKGVRRTAPSMA